MLTLTPAAQEKLGELLTGRDGPESMVRVWVDPTNGHAPYGMMLVSGAEASDTLVRVVSSEMSTQLPVGVYRTALRTTFSTALAMRAASPITSASLALTSKRCTACSYKSGSVSNPTSTTRGPYTL